MADVVEPTIQLQVGGRVFAGLNYKLPGSSAEVTSANKATGAKMFWRILLLTYFATGAAWGPTYCCCRVSQLLEAGLERIKVSLAVAPNLEASAAEACPRCRAAAERKASSRPCCRAVGGEQSAPQSTCPCHERGDRDNGLWSFAYSDHHLLRAGLASDFAGLLSSILPQSGPEAKAQQHGGWKLLEFPPRHLFGRALLRAYQTLNC